MDWPNLGWLIGVLVAIAIPVAVIFIVLIIFRMERLRAQRAVRDPSYWDEEPDTRRYPTGWERRHQDPRAAPSGEEDQARTGEDPRPEGQQDGGEEPGEGGEPPGEAPPPPPSGRR